MSPRAVLLTGATGSLGGWLCAQLLETTPATVYCLVRAADQAAADHRLAARLDEFGVSATARLIAVPADIDRYGLGLDPGAFDALAETVEEIFHCAARVNLAAPYGQLAATNVGGTENMIALAERRNALTGSAPGFHYVSTLGTFLHIGNLGQEFADETCVPTPATAGSLGYPLTKVAAEAAVRAAAARGVLRYTIHRPAIITGEHASGCTADSDLLVPMLDACVALRARPDSGYLAPGIDCVDTVARAIVGLALTPAMRGRTFHTIQTAPLSLVEVLDALVRAGYPMRSVSVPEWWRLVDEHATNPDVIPVAAMREVSDFLLADDSDHKTPIIRADITAAALAEVGIPAPALDADFYDRLVKALQQSRTLPIPPAMGSSVRQ